MAKYSINPGANVADVKIITHKMGGFKGFTDKNPSDFTKFLIARKELKKKGQDLSIIDYIKKEYYADSDVVIIPDFSNQSIVGNPGDELDLQNIDFSGSRMLSTKFDGCDLSGAVFCDSNLQNVSFADCYLNKSDFRGSQLLDCKIFSHNMDVPEMLEGAKFSTTLGALLSYQEKNNQKIVDAKSAFQGKKQEDYENLAQKRKKIQDKLDSIYSQLSAIEKINLNYLGRGINNEAYNRNLKLLDNLQQQIIANEQRKFESENMVEHIFSRNIEDIMLAKLVFDPAYIIASGEQERLAPKEYVKMNKADMEEFITLASSDALYSLSDFAKDKAKKMSAIEYDENKIFIADFSSDKARGEIDLAGIDFSGLNLQGGCFVGTNMKQTIFNGANIQGVSFENANLENSEFIGTSAGAAKFFGANIKNVKIEGGDFKSSILQHANAENITIKKGQLVFADISYSNMQDAKIYDSNMDSIRGVGADLSRAIIKRSSMRNAMLQKAILEQSIIEESDLSQAVLSEVNAQKIVINNSILSKVQAYKANLQYAELDELVKLDGANLEAAILRYARAVQVDFTGAVMNEIDLSFANIQGCSMSAIQARFADFNHAIANNIIAHDADFTKSNFEKINARQADFSNAIMKQIEAQKADFTEAILQDANLNAADLTEAILRRVKAAKADLKNADMSNADLYGANISEAKVNPNTNLLGARVDRTKGKFALHRDGKAVGHISPQNQVENSERIRWARNMPQAIVKINDKLQSVFEGVKTKVNFFMKAFELVKKFVKSPAPARALLVAGVVAIGVSVMAIAVLGGSHVGLVGIAAIVAGSVMVGVGVAAIGSAYYAKSLYDDITKSSAHVKSKESAMHLMQEADIASAKIRTIAPENNITKSLDPASDYELRRITARRAQGQETLSSLPVTAQNRLEQSAEKENVSKAVALETPKQEAGLGSTIPDVQSLTTPQSSPKEPTSKLKEPIATSKEPTSTSKESKSKSKEPIATSKEPTSTSKESKSKSKEPTSTSKESKSKSKEPIATSKEPTSTSKESKSKSKEPTSKSKEPTSKSKSFSKKIQEARDNKDLQVNLPKQN